MKHKCDKCEQKATLHQVEIVKGQKIEMHLCDQCAQKAGLAVPKDTFTPMNELLTNFVKVHSGAAAAGSGGAIAAVKQKDTTCDNCGLTFSQFREQSLLGCPNCYKAFEATLGPLLERAQEGGTHHLGKVPSRSGSREERQEQLLRMRRRLADAVSAEDYELAARLRDDISRFEEPKK